MLPGIVTRLKTKIIATFSPVPEVKSPQPPQEPIAILKAEMNSYFSSHPEKKNEYSAELNFISNIPESLPSEYRLFYSLYPYPYILNYRHEDVEVFRDVEAEMYYVMLDGKKLFYHKGYKNIEDVQKSFACLTAEQNPDSPHCYQDDFFSLNEGDIVADFGAAEGNFSLMIADKVKRLIIIESDPVWNEALEKTFEPWKHKVRIINKLAGSSDDDNTITLSELIKEESLTAIKMDIEGAEVGVLESAGEALRNRSLKFSVCSYHFHDDADKIKKILEANGYTVKFSDNYMLFIYDKLKPPYFRKGLVKALK
jgi:hypothetical protein